MELNVIRRISIEAQTKGVADATGQLNKLADAQGNVAVASETASKSSLSVERALERQRRSLDEAYRSQKQFERAQADLDRAMKQGLLGMSEFNRLSDLNRQRMGQATASTKAYAAAQDEVRAAALAAAGSLGGMGGALTAIGPAGLAVAAVIGALTLGIKAAVDASNELADRAGKMVDFAETTGLTTTQLQALQKAAAFVGIEADKVGTGFEKFTTTLEELRRGSGSLYEGLNRINPALTSQLRLTQDAGAAWDVLSKAIANATTQEQKNAIARAAFGRQGIPFTRLAGATTEAGGLAGLEQSLGQINTLSNEQLKRWDELKDKIDYTTKLAKQNVASIFTSEVLETQLRFAESWLKFSQTIKEFSISGDLAQLLAALTPSGSLGKFIPVIQGMLSALELARTAADAVKGTNSRASGGVGYDESGFTIQGANVPLPHGRPAQADPRFDLARLQAQITAMGGAADAADNLRAAEMQLAIVAKEAGLSQEQYNRALRDLRAVDALSDMREYLSVMGDSATVTDMMTYKVASLTRAYDLGKISLDDYLKRMGDLKRDQDIQFERARISALGDAATETEKYTLRIAELQRALDQGRISQETFNRAVIAAHPLFQPLTDAAGNFFNTLAQGFAQGRSLSDSFRTSLKGVASDLTSIATKNIGQGIKTLASGGGFGGFDPVSLGIGAVGMVLGSILGKQEEKKRQQEAMWQANIDAVNEANRKIKESQEKLAEEQARIAEETARRIEAAAQRVRSFEDIIFAATNDNSTLEGKMAALQREQDQALIDERKAGGEAEFILLASYEAKRYALLKESNDNIIEEERRSAAERLQATETAARQITDYLLNLRRGSDSPLSASGRLTQSQNAYNATLSLAQGGNLDALGRITQDAEALRTAAQAFFGSGSGYQSIFNQIQQQLTALPAVQNSTDPVVQALNNIASRQENVFFDNMAESAAQTAAYNNTSVVLQNQMVAALNRLTLLQAAASQQAADAAAAQQAATNAAAQQAADSAAQTRASNKKRYDDAWLNYISLVASGQVPASYPTPKPENFSLPVGFNSGMTHAGYAWADGGRITGPGTATSDSIPAWLSNGEGVVNAAAMRSLDAQHPRLFDDYINRGRLPSNDNGAVVSELRALRKENAMMQGQIAKLTAQLCGVVASGFDRQTTAIKDSDKRERANGMARKRGAAA